MGDKEQGKSAYEIVQKQLQLLLDVSESMENRQDRIQELCLISEAMARLMASLPDEVC